MNVLNILFAVKTSPGVATWLLTAYVLKLSICYPKSCLWTYTFNPIKNYSECCKMWKIFELHCWIVWARSMRGVVCEASSLLCFLIMLFSRLGSFTMITAAVVWVTCRSLHSGRKQDGCRTLWTKIIVVNHLPTPIVTVDSKNWRLIRPRKFTANVVRNLVDTFNCRPISRIKSSSSLFHHVYLMRVWSTVCAMHLNHYISVDRMFFNIISILLVSTLLRSSGMQKITLAYCCSRSNTNLWQQKAALARRTRFSPDKNVCHVAIDTVHCVIYHCLGDCSHWHCMFLRNNN